MSRRGAGAFVVLLALVASLPALALPDPDRPPIQIEVSFREPAALFDLLERISRWRLPGEDLDERHLGYWRGAVGERPEDMALFAEYQALRRAMEAQDAEPRVVESFRGLALPQPVETAALRPPDPLALAVLAAADWDTLWPRLHERFGAERAAALRGLFERAEARFGHVLRRALFLHTHAARARAVVTAPAVRSFLGQLPKIFALRAQDAPVFHVRLAWVPPGTQQTRATVHGAYALVQVPEGIGQRHVLDVAVHELVHRLNEAMPLAARARLEAQFLELGREGRDARLGAAAANVLFEALATTIGQGIFAERFFPEDFDTQRAWYEDEGYDAVAKATKELVARYLDEGRPLDEDFVRDYLTAYRQVRGGATEEDALRRAFVLAPNREQARALAQAVQGRVRARFLLPYALSDEAALREALATFPGMTVLAAGPQPQLARLRRLGLRAGKEGARPTAGPLLLYPGLDPVAAFTARFGAAGRGEPGRPRP